MNDLHGPQAPIRRTGQGTTILLIEDDPDQCTLIQTGLQACMPEVNLLRVATPQQARYLLDEGGKGTCPFPRLILLDLYLPTRADGLQFVAWLKQPASPYRLIPITLLSQSSKTEDIQSSYDAGANTFITKPTDYPQWLTYFEALSQYWWHTVSLPSR